TFLRDHPLRLKGRADGNAASHAHKFHFLLIARHYPLSVRQLLSEVEENPDDHLAILTALDLYGPGCQLLLAFPLPEVGHSFESRLRDFLKGPKIPSEDGDPIIVRRNSQGFLAVRFGDRTAKNGQADSGASQSHGRSPLDGEAQGATAECRRVALRTSGRAWIGTPTPRRGPATAARGRGRTRAHFGCYIQGDGHLFGPGRVRHNLAHVVFVPVLVRLLLPGIGGPGDRGHGQEG